MFQCNECKRFHPEVKSRTTTLCNGCYGKKQKAKFPEKLGWTEKIPCCQNPECGTTKVPFAAKGLCCSCYSVKYRKDHYDTVRESELRRKIRRNIGDVDVILGKLLDISKNGYPYLEVEEKALIRDWNKVKEVKDEIRVLNGVKYCFKGEKAIKINGNLLSSHFARSRFEVAKPTLMSLVDAFRSPEKLQKLANRFKNFGFPLSRLTDGWARNYMEGCGVASAYNFRAGTAKALIQELLPEGGVVYDYSAGFGGRMIGIKALGSKYEYIGIEPREKGIKELKEISDFIELKEKNRDKKGKVSLFQAVSEEFCPEELRGRVDVAFSSPPYYNRELYSDEETQSCIRYPKYEDWLKGYWKGTVGNIKELLKSGGYLVLNINEEYGNDMRDIVLKEGFSLVDTYRYVQGADYRKTHLYEGDAGINSEPIYVFKKN